MSKFDSKIEEALSFKKTFTPPTPEEAESRTKERLSEDLTKIENLLTAMEDFQQGFLHDNHPFFKDRLANSPELMQQWNGHDLKRTCDLLGKSIFFMEKTFETLKDYISNKP